MHIAKRTLAIMAAAGCLALIGTGCESGQKTGAGAEHPSAEHPTNGEHPKGEHPEGEHPQKEHPEGEHPEG